MDFNGVTACIVTAATLACHPVDFAPWWSDAELGQGATLCSQRNGLVCWNIAPQTARDLWRHHNCTVAWQHVRSKRSELERQTDRLKTSIKFQFTSLGQDERDVKLARLLLSSAEKEAVRQCQNPSERECAYIRNGIRTFEERGDGQMANEWRLDLKQHQC
jgi:hypothetical protein